MRSKFVTDRETDRQTKALTPYMGVCGFFFKLNLLPPYSLHSQGDNFFKKVYESIECKNDKASETIGNLKNIVLNNYSSPQMKIRAQQREATSIKPYLGYFLSIHLKAYFTNNDTPILGMYVTGGKWKSNRITSVPKSVPHLVVDKVRLCVVI